MTELNKFIRQVSSVMQSIPYSCAASIDPQPSKTSPKGWDFQEIPVNGSCNLVGFGKGAALDLIKGHLTEQTYIPATRGLENDPVGWFVPSVDYDPQKETHFVAKLQAFESGGYEVTISEQNLHDLAYLMDMERKSGPREKGEQNENDVASSINRAKVKVRKLIKSMGCDRLLTLTKKESDPQEFWTREDWAAAWDKFIRLCKKAGVTLQYVAVLEAHKKGNFHLHAAIVGRLNCNLARGIWLSIIGGGKGCGNVDIAMRQNCTAHKRRAGLAKYVSKYITKQADLVEFNKKRYWSSRHKLPAPKRYVMNSGDLVEALKELCSMLALDFHAVSKAAFIFPALDGFDPTGLWFSFDDDLSKPVPF